GGGNDAGAGARARGPPDEDGRFKPLSRTFSEPPVVAQRTRLQTPPSRGAGGRSSRGPWAGPPPQQGTPSRPPLTPPSPAKGSGSLYSRRGSGGGMRAIPILQKQQQQQQQQQQQSSFLRSGRGYDDRDRDDQGNNEGWSPHGHGEGRYDGG
ncbi:unnamed protein product, partial [Ectocarpus sp. 12 AP-2014]